MLVISHFGQKKWSGHRNLDRLLRKGGDRPEFISEAEVDIIEDSGTAGCRRVKDIGIVGRDRLGAGWALERRNLLPEVVQHRIRRRVAIVGAPVHFAAGDDVDAGDLLIEDCRLAGAILGIRH